MWSLVEAPFKVVGTVLTVSTLVIGGTYKGVNFVDTHFAHQDDVEMISMRLDEKVTNDRANQVQGRIWRLEEQYGMDRNKWPLAVQQEVKELELRKEKLDKHLEKIDEQMMKQGISPSEIR